jgi:hypothetical protein
MTSTRITLNNLDALQSSSLTQLVINQRYLDAGSPSTSGRILNELAQEKDFRVRARVAENPNTPLWTVLRLAADENHEVRLAAFFNAKLPQIFHEQLANDPHEDVRYAIASDPCTPKGILQLLADDLNVFVKDRAEKTIERLRGKSVDESCGCLKMAA